jgi:tetratricopeptide (TPR) repeat protein
MGLRSPTYFSGAFLCLAIIFTAVFNVAIRTDPNAALSRFETLVDTGALRRAAPHGERAIALSLKNNASENDIAALKITTATTQIARKNYQRGAELMRQGLSTPWGEALDKYKRIEIENQLGQAYINAGRIEEAVSIYASFLELAGDAAVQSSVDGAQKVAGYYADMVAAADTAFAGALNHADAYKITAGSLEQTLATTNHMASLGGFYGARSGAEYAAAGLLSSAYETRKKILGVGHQDTVQITLILGPLYTKMGRLEDAEKLYLDAFHAQERAKGANSPDLSLYIKLLAGLYEKQNRFTEAQALYEHMRGLFRDAFGAQRYAINRVQDRRAYINRPVSQYFPLEKGYAPRDLVSTAEYSVPTSKAPSADEMKVRLAPDADADPREANLPVRLAQLISLCRNESGERISLRSGYRSYNTQRILFDRIGAKGTVTPPGVSEHQTGLAVDINVGDRFMRQSDRTSQCFEENAFRFGFILSYPPDNNYLPSEDSYEPWHWRYVGVQTAQLYREAGPYNQPQEFLAALPCYQERAATGSFPTAGEPDICLEQPKIITATASEQAAKQPIGENPETARILNDSGNAARARR